MRDGCQSPARTGAFKIGPGLPGGAGLPLNEHSLPKTAYFPKTKGLQQFSLGDVNWFTYARNNTLHAGGYRMA
jgi:hypothetical protein